MASANDYRRGRVKGDSVPKLERKRSPETCLSHTAHLSSEKHPVAWNAPSDWAGHLIGRHELPSTDAGQDRRNPIAVAPVCFAEAHLQFALFGTNHHDTGDHAKGGHSVDNDHASADAPAEELDQVCQVDGMAYMLPDPGGDQVLLVVMGMQLRSTKRLVQSEVAKRSTVEVCSGNEEWRGWKPGPRCVVGKEMAPWERDGSHEEPEREPDWSDQCKRCFHSAEVPGAGVDQQPQSGDGGVHDSDKPSHEAHSVHEDILCHRSRSIP